MPFVPNTRSTEHLKRFLPEQALKVFCKAASEAEMAGLPFNDCIRSGWGAVSDAGWRKPETGKKYVKDDPSPGSVHVDAVIGSKSPKKPKPKEIGDDEDATVKFESTGDIVKVDESLGLVFGFAIVCKKDGEDYYDVQDDHIPEDAMMKAAADFMENSRVAKEMHVGDQKGGVIFAFPLTTEIAKALGIETEQTGLLIAMKPPPEVLSKFKSGEYTGFSIGGRRVEDEEVDD
jgi:hypothetical protein